MVCVLFIVCCLRRFSSLLFIMLLFGFGHLDCGLLDCLCFSRFLFWVCYARYLLVWCLGLFGVLTFVLWFGILVYC